MLKIYYKSSPEEELKEIQTPQKGCWIHLDQASPPDLEQLAGLTHIDQITLSDCLDKYEIPRIEKDEEHIFIFTRYPSDTEVGLYTTTLTLIFAEDLFITVSPHKSDLIQQFMEKKANFTTTDRTKLLIQLLLRINQEYTFQIRKIRHSVLSAEKEMIAVGSDDIASLTKNEEILNQYLSSLVPKRSVLESIHTGRYLTLYENERELIEDCINTVKQSEELCGIVLKSIRSLRDAYQIIFTNNLHKTIKLLTALTIILSIPTMIASVYGMNVNLPLAHSSFAFGIVMGFTALLSALGLWVFRRRGWL